MNPTRNIFFSFDHDDQMRPVAPCRTIPITDAIRREDAAKQAARKVVITWKPRFSDPRQKVDAKPKAHTPAHTPRKPGSLPRHRPCAQCPDGKISRCNRHGMCRDCRKARAIAKRKRVLKEDREKHRMKEAARIKARRDAGLCARCKLPNPTELMRCPACQEKHKSVNNRGYQRKKKKKETAQ